VASFFDVRAPTSRGDFFPFRKEPPSWRVSVVGGYIIGPPQTSLIAMIGKIGRQASAHEQHDF